MNDTNKKHSLEAWKTNFSLIIPVVTTLTFIIGSFWGHTYYKQFGIDFFLFSNFSSAFTFLFNNIFLVLVSLLTSLIVYFIIGFTSIQCINVTLLVTKYTLPKLHASLLIKSKQRLSTALSYTLLILILVGIAIGIAILIKSFTVKTALNIKNNLQSNKYAAINVYYEEGSISELTCVRSLGLVGEYRVFIDSQLKTTLIKESNIKRISYPITFVQGTEYEPIRHIIKTKPDDFCPNN